MPRHEICGPSPEIRRLRDTASDAALVSGVQRGSEPHFNALYERYFQRIFSFVCQRVRNRSDAEEIVQEVFTVVFRSVGSWRGQSSLAGWMYGIAKNTVNNHIRRVRSQEARIDRAEAELARSPHSVDHCSPEEHLNLVECQDVIRDRLSSVAEWHAEAFLMRHFENLSIGEISSRLDRSNDAVRSSLYRMKKLLVDAVDLDIAATH